MLKVYLSADLEGINGVTYPEHTEPGSEKYQDSIKQQQKEIECIVETLLRFDVDLITINDAHSKMDNIKIAGLGRKVELVTGKPKPISMVYGLDKTYSFAIFLGYHARAGSSKGVLPHTFSKIFKSVKLNGKPAGEIEFNGIYSSLNNVPVRLVTGDDETCSQAIEFLGNIETVITKTAVSSTSCICKSNFELFEELKEKTKKILTKSEPYIFPKPDFPYIMEYEFLDIRFADKMELLPCVEKISNGSFRYESNNFSDCYKLLQFISINFLYSSAAHSTDNFLNL